MTTSIDEAVSIKAFNNVVEQAGQQGVKLAKKIEPVANPYMLPPGEAVRAARRAGIITRSGTLSARFR